MQHPVLVIGGREIKFSPPVPRTELESERYVRNIWGNMLPSTAHPQACPRLNHVPAGGQIDQAAACDNGAC